MLNNPGWSVLGADSLIRQYVTVMIYLVAVLVVLSRWPKLPRR